MQTNQQSQNLPCYKMIVAYDGTDYEGWQAQTRTKNTIVGVLQTTFKQVFVKDISIFGASRTDAGVHATGQVARFYVDINIPTDRMLKQWNIHLPAGILIRSLEKLDQPFNPCMNVEQKIYYYHIFLRPPLPFIARYGWNCPFINDVDFQKFEQALQLFIGTHNFRSFCKVDKEKLPELENGLTIKTVDKVCVKKISKFGILQVQMYGKAFLHFQIRRMIGYALDVARRKNLSISYLQELLDNPTAEQILLKAPASGLLLRKIMYKKEIKDE